MHSRVSSLVVLLLLLLPGARPADAAPTLELTGVVVVGRAARGAAWSDAATEARAGAGAELAIVGVARAGKQTVYLVDAEVTPLALGGHEVAARARREWSAFGDVAVRWSKVEPDAWRQGPTPAANGADTSFYTNVVSGGAEHGKWLGYDRISYYETPLGDFARGAAARRHEASARPSHAADDVYDGLGTMRYKVELRMGTVARPWTSPGAAATDVYGILPTVHRVSIRRDDSTLGWLTAYFLVPEVFGSAGPGADHQTERFVGADCADVLVGARRRQGFKVAYTSVKGLTSHARQVAGTVELDASGAVVEGTRPTGLRAGDIVRIDYAGAYAGLTARSWDHVAMVYQDRSDPDGPSHGAADGQLDRFDLVVHMGHPRLIVEPLAAQLPAKLDVLRW